MYHYVADFWDEIDEQRKIEQGFLAASSYSEAIDCVIEYYGKENIFEVTLCKDNDLLTESDIKEMLAAYAN